jgi:hypothetical protein
MWEFICPFGTNPPDLLLEYTAELRPFVFATSIIYFLAAASFRNLGILCGLRNSEFRGPHTNLRP